MVAETNDLDWLCDDTNDDDNTQPDDAGSWNILIVDDDPHVHEVTVLALKGFQFEDRGLNFIHAYSKAECQEALQKQDDIALILLDVVMETEHAGLEVVKYLRGELGNSVTRVILRTGQPGIAPERQVIREYDIDGYGNKAQMRQHDLEIALLTSLRSYRDVCRLQTHKATLEKIISAISSISRLGDLESFSNAILEHIQAILALDDLSIFLISRDEMLGSEWHGCCRLLIVNDQGVSFYDNGLAALSSKEYQLYQDVKQHKTSKIDGSYIGHYWQNDKGSECVFGLQGHFRYSEEETRLIRLFLINVIEAYEKILIAQSLQHTQSLILSLLGSSAEPRSYKTGNHVLRIGKYAAALARAMGCSDGYVSVIQLAAQLQDVGQTSMPDRTLNSPAKLTAEELVPVSNRILAGWKELYDSDCLVVEMAEQIAVDFYERWDGRGEPDKKAATDISLAGRIAAVVGAFETTCRKGCDIDAARQAIVLGAGEQFDPEVVAAFEENFGLFAAIRKANPDGGPSQ